VEDAFQNIANLVITPRPRTPIKSTWGLMDPDEVGSLKDALDHIIADFAEQYGGIDNATPVIKHQMELSGLSLASPSEVSVMQFIERLAKIESCFKKPDEVEQNRIDRLQLFGYKKD